MPDHTDLIVKGLIICALVGMVTSVIVVFRGKDPAGLFAIATGSVGALAGLARPRSGDKDNSA